MGQDGGRRSHKSQPRVHLDTRAIDCTEVTTAAFGELLEGTGYEARRGSAIRSLSVQREGEAVMEKKGRGAALHAVLRPAFAVALFLSQFASHRTSFFTANRAVLAVGAAVTAAGVALWVAASVHLRRAQQADVVGTTGPFRSIRHPIYVSIYVLSVGMGLMFFSWTWFLVLVVFIPFWYRECRLEEEEMEERYGEVYASYRERTKMFIPGVV